MSTVCIKPLLVALLFFSATGCTKDQEEKLPVSIQKLIAENENCICEPFIDKFEYRGAVMYLLANRGPACNSIAIFFYAQGKQTDWDYNKVGVDQFLGEAKNLGNIWTCNATGS